VITLPNLIYTGAYGTVELQPSFVKTAIAGMGYVEGNTITITTDDNGAVRPISFSNLKTSSFTNLPPIELSAKTPVTATFLGSSVNFTAVDQSASWNGAVGEPIDEPEGDLPADFPDLSFHYYPQFTGERDRSLSYGGSYDEGWDFMRYINRVNDDEVGNYTNLTDETTMKKIADTTGNIYMVNTYPNEDGKILDVIGNNLYARSSVGKITGISSDGKHAMIGGDESTSLYLVNTSTHIFPPETTSAEMKAALAVGEMGYSKQADGSIISMVNMGDYSEDGNHISYQDLSYPGTVWPAMIRNQHTTPTSDFDADAYHAKMVEADGATTPPLFAAGFFSTVIVEDPSDGETTYPIKSTIEGMEGIIREVNQSMRMDPVKVNTAGLAAIKIAYKSGSTTVGPTKTIYAESNTTLSSYMENNSTEKLFPESFVMGPITYKLKEEPVTKDFGAIGSTVTINVEYEPQATIQLDYQSDGKTIAPSKLIYAGEQTSLTDYLTNHAGDKDKLLPKEIKVGTTVYRLIDFDATSYKFGAGGSLTPVKVEYAKAADLGFWTPQPGYDLTKNIGTYGDPGLELFVYSKDPFLDKIVGDPMAPENQTKVLAKGTFGFKSLADAARWYIDMDHVLHINSGATAWLTGETSPWIAYKDIITKVVIEGKLSINPNSKGLFGSLDKVTSYSGLEKLDFSLTYPGFETYNYIDLSYLFKNNTLLAELSGEEAWNLSKVTNTFEMFSNSGIKTLDAGNWKFGAVTIVQDMFLNTVNLTEISGEGTWDLTKVTTAYRMFSGSGINTLDAETWGFDKLTVAYGMFLNAKNLTVINGIENWKMTETTTMWSMFQNASSLESLDFSGWNTTKLGYVSYMLSGDTSLKEITFGEKFSTDTSGEVGLPNTTTTTKWRNVADGTVAAPLGSEFTSTYKSGTNVADTYVLTDKVGAKIDYTDKSLIPEQVVATDYLSGLVGSAVSYDVLDPWRADLLKDIPYVYAGGGMSAFNYTPDPLSITLTVDNIDNKVIPMKKIAEVTKLPTAMPEAIPETTPAKGIFGDVEWYIDLGGTLHFGEETFGDMGTLTESPWKDYNDLIKTISFEGSVKANTSMSHLFMNLTNVTAISGLEKVDVSTTENMNGTFSNMTSLPVLGFSGWQTPNVTNMLNMLSGDTSLKEVTFDSGFVTPQVTTAETVGQLELPNDTKTIKWQNVAEGTVTKPLGEEFIGAYKSGTNVPDTYVLVNDTVTPNFPNTGSNLRLIALISASGMILFGLLGASWYKRKQNIE
ncbi:BspA family leucine-rich repeat surface protein, partial [Enterococcus dongliensis]|uniref:BspA family leucine-rich repeat surface protein n=1 Tax=Enterococcus dongliensis TaxID=2559925 RepID=UPI002891AEE5